MKPLEPDKPVKGLPIRHINIHKDCVLITYKGYSLPSLYYFEGDDKETIFTFLRNLCEEKVID